MNLQLINETFIPERLERWTLPDSYFGPSFDEYYIVIGQNRDSDILTRSNFESALNELKGESETVRVIRQGHWACGWIELLMVHESDVESLVIADKMMKDYDSYPVIDESHFSEMEHEEVSRMTEDNMSYFLKELLEHVGCEEELSKDDEESLEQFIYYATQEDASYRGADDAYFRPEESDRFIDEYIRYNLEYIKGKNAELILLSLVR